MQMASWNAMVYYFLKVWQWTAFFHGNLKEFTWILLGNPYKKPCTSEFQYLLLIYSWSLLGLFMRFLSWEMCFSPKERWEESKRRLYFSTLPREKPELSAVQGGKANVWTEQSPYRCCAGGGGGWRREALFFHVVQFCCSAHFLQCLQSYYLNEMSFRFLTSIQKVWKVLWVQIEREKQYRVASIPPLFASAKLLQGQHFSSKTSVTSQLW